MRRKILETPYSKWKRMGYSKGTLHYLKKNARSEKPFKIYGKAREKLIGSVTSDVGVTRGCQKPEYDKGLQ